MKTEAPLPVKRVNSRPDKHAQQGFTADLPEKGSYSNFRSLFSVRGCLFFLISAFSCLYLLEAQSHSPWEIPFGLQLFNVFFFLLLIFLWLSITSSGLAAVLMTALIALFIGYANHAVLIFRDNPIFPWDLLSIQTAISVSDNYSWPLPENPVLLICLLLLVVAAGLAARIRISRGRMRRILAAASVTGLLGFGLFLQSQPLTSFFNFNETLFTQSYLYRQNGFIPSFLMNVRYIRVDKPDNYSQEQMQALAERIDEELVDEILASEPFTSDLPNILVVMNEAFSDLSVVSPLKTNLETMPFFQSLEENTIRGDLYVSVIGGNTATTEFEFLTGDSMAFLPNGSVAYQQFIHRNHPGLPTVLKEAGYQTIAMHPFGRDGWNRDQVYPQLGFDEMLFFNDFEHRDYIRQYVSDRSVYQQMIDRFEEKEAADRLFCFAVTMQNHGGYSEIDENFEPAVSVENPDDRFDYAQTELYLSLIHESDQALASLIEYFTAVDEKTIILFFGDHQPHDYAIQGLLAQNGYGYSEEEMARSRMMVPFCLWANYPIDARQDEVISANFLSSLLLKTAEVPQSPYGYFLSDLQQTIPVMTATFYRDAHRFYTYDEAPLQHQQLLHQYELLQYNHLFDESKRLDSFFQPVQQQN